MQKKNLELISNSELIDILCVSENQSGESGLDPKKIVFYTGSTARPLGGGKYQGGIRIDIS